MNYMQCERETLDRYLPGLDAALTSHSFEALEAPGGPGINLFREAGGPGLLAPVKCGGLGATPLDAIRIHKALGSRSPILGIAATMHNFSLATLVEYGEYSRDFLCNISMGKLLVA